jgi:hypothetical protein
LDVAIDSLLAMVGDNAPLVLHRPVPHGHEHALDRDGLAGLASVTKSETRTFGGPKWSRTRPAMTLAATLHMHPSSGHVRLGQQLLQLDADEFTSHSRKTASRSIEIDALRRWFAILQLGKVFSGYEECLRFVVQDEALIQR